MGRRHIEGVLLLPESLQGLITTARAYLEIGEGSQSVAVLRALYKSAKFDGILGADRKQFKQEIAELLEPHGGADVDYVTYAD